MYNDDLFTDSGKQHGICSRTIAAANYHNCFPSVKHAIAGCTVIDASSNQLLFFFQSQFSGRSTCRNYHSFPIKNTFTGIDLFDLTLQFYRIYFCQFCFCTKAFCACLHLFCQFKTIHTIFKTGIVINLGSQCHLSACREFFQQKHIQPCPCRI